MQKRTTISNSNDNNNNSLHGHRRQHSEGIMAARLYRNEDRRLIQNLVNEYLLGNSNDVLDLIRHCPRENFEALIDFIWHTSSHTMDSNEDDLAIYNQRSSLLSSALINVHREGARRRLAILCIEIFKLLATPNIYGGRADIQRQSRIFSFPWYAGQLISFEPDTCGLSCLALASVILINPNIIHSRVSILMEALKQTANLFLQANLSLETPSTYAVSIYALFYLLYLLYPNTLRRELQPDASNERTAHRMGVERILLPFCYYFKFQPSIVCGSCEAEKQESRWQNESWQQIIANGDRYVVSEDGSPLMSNDFKKRKEEELKKSTDPKRFEIKQIIRMCNEYTESVLHPSEVKSQIVKNTIENQNGKRQSNDCYSTYSDSYCQTYEQQWQTTIQNAQMSLTRVQAADESNRGQNNNYTNGASAKKNSNLNNSVQSDRNIHARADLQLDMLDYNYEHDKREYYAQLIRDYHRTMPIQDLEKTLKNEEIRYGELVNVQEQKRRKMHERRTKIDEFNTMNETFHCSLSSTRIELRTDEDEHNQQRSSFIEKQMKLKNDVQRLEQKKVSLENDIRELQRRSFQCQQEANQSGELRDTIDKLLIDLVCARKKHQLLHNALVNVKFKPVDVENLFVQSQHDDDSDSADLTTLDQKKKKFEEFKKTLETQQIELTTRRNSFNQIRNMNTQKINTIRRQIDSTRICQTQLNMMKTTSQIMSQQQ